MLSPHNRLLLKGLCRVEQKRTPASEPWPRHGVGRYNEVLEVARANGWTLSKLKDHGGFKITCPDEQCEERIYSSPRNAEARAKYALRKVRRCPHNRDNQGGVAVAHEYMDQSARLIDAAAKMIESQREYHSLESLAEDAVSEGEVTDLLEAAAALEIQAEQALPGKWQGATESDIADGAQQSLSVARTHLNPLDRENPSVKEAWGRLKVLKSRLKIVRDQMGVGGAQPS